MCVALNRSIVASYSGGRRKKSFVFPFHCVKSGIVSFFDSTRYCVFPLCCLFVVTTLPRGTLTAWNFPLYRITRYAWPTPSINKYCREAYRRRSQEPDERFHATDGVSVVVKARDLLLSTLREDSRALDCDDKGGDVSGGKRKTPFLHRQACSFHRLV